MLRSALLFYKKLRSELEKMGFVINPYDPCVANKMVNGSQMLAYWHVDDLKISHAYHDLVTVFIMKLGKLYGPKMTLSPGTIHDYLGMNMDYESQEGALQVYLIPCAKKCINNFPEEIRITSSSPAGDYLFNIREDNTDRIIPGEQAQHFRHSGAQLLFLSMRNRPYLQTAVAFLTTHVKQPDEDIWGKLKRELNYLKGTLHMKITLTVDNMNTLHLYVDASYGTHWDCKGHTGMMMTWGKGALMSLLQKQKLNGRSSTEAKLIGIDDAILYIM